MGKTSSNRERIGAGSLNHAEVKNGSQKGKREIGGRLRDKTLLTEDLRLQFPQDRIADNVFDSGNLQMVVTIGAGRPPLITARHPINGHLSAP